MGYLLASVVLAALAALVIVATAKTRAARREERERIAVDLAGSAAYVAQSETCAEAAFRPPQRFHEDRTHDTMFGVRFGDRELSFILDTSGRRLVWWVLRETFAPDDDGVMRRVARNEATFDSEEPECAHIRVLLKAARGERLAPSPPPRATETEPAAQSVDPFERPPDPPHAAQDSSLIAAATGD